LGWLVALQVAAPVVWGTLPALAQAGDGAGERSEGEPAAQVGESTQATTTAAQRTNIKAKDAYRLKIGEGDRAYLARDFDGAVALYTEAIKQEPRRALGHFRLGESYRAQSKFEEAFEALGNAARFARTLELKARAVFVMADTYERASRLPQARDEWNVYLKIAEQHADLVSQKRPGTSAEDAVYVASAEERLKQIAAAVERAEAYAAVKDRIEKREAELDEKTRAKEKAKESQKATPQNDL
jgi:tetratricopeptide (TPR) repeat protein